MYRYRIYIFLFALSLAHPAVAQEKAAEVQDTLVLVTGASGTTEYRDEFALWADSWKQLAKERNWKLEEVASEKDGIPPKQRLQEALKSAQSAPRVWIVFVGHGTYARNIAKFNLAGPDVSSKEMKTWLDPIKAPTIFLNCSSSSAPFLTELAAYNRILVTATKSGSEYNFSRFGKYMAEAINNIENDIDHDKEVSLLEAFLAASNGTQRFYSDEARLATEHALINDNGDKVGTPSDFYRGLRPAKAAKEGEIDGRIASRVILLSSPDSIQFTRELDAQRLKLEEQLDKLRRQKSILREEAYFDELEKIMLEISNIYDKAEAAS